MTFDNLEKRLEHWSTGWTAVNQGDSPPHPFLGYQGYFKGTKILEIGPGEGRQYNLAKHWSVDYSIADISQQVLDCPVFNGVSNKYLLRNFDDPLFDSFDLIHFWYMLHHVTIEELEPFVKFIHRHLYHEGLVMFNTPYLDFHKGAYSDDGVNTTPFNIIQIMEAFEPYFFCLVIDGRNYGRSNGYIYIGRKK